MNPNQFPPQFNPQGPPNHPQGPWQQQGQQPMPGQHNAQAHMPGTQSPHAPMPEFGLPNPQQQQQQPSGLQSPRPQHAQGPPAFANAQTPQLHGMYPPPIPPGGQPQQPMAQAQGQQGPPPFPLADQTRIAPGPHHIVPAPGQVPPGTIPQAQQAQQSTPVAPSQQQTPRPPHTPLPVNAQSIQGGPPSVHSQHPPQHGTPARPVGAPGQFGPPPQVQLPMHGGPLGMQPQQQPPLGNMPMPMPMPMGPNHPSGLSEHPLHQGMPQMMPPTGQQPMPEGLPMPPPASPSAHPSVHGGSQVTPPAQAGPPAVNLAPFVHNVQAAGASAQQAQPMHVRGADLSHDHIEDFHERFSNMRVKEVMDLTEKHQIIWHEPPEEDLKSALEDSLKMYDAHQMKKFAEERERIHAAVMENLFQGGGGSGRGAGNGAPKGRPNSLASSKKSKKNSEGNDSPVNDPPRPPRSSPTPSKHVQTQVPVTASIPDEETANVVHEKQPAARNVNLERSRSPARCLSRPRRHRRRDAEWERWSSGRRGGAEGWRHAGMYYSSGAYRGSILDSARPRPKRGTSEP